MSDGRLRRVRRAHALYFETGHERSTHIVERQFSRRTRVTTSLFSTLSASSASSRASIGALRDTHRLRPQRIEHVLHVVGELGHALVADHAGPTLYGVGGSEYLLQQFAVVWTRLKLNDALIEHLNVVVRLG